MDDYNRHSYALSQIGQTAELEIKSFSNLEKEGWFFAQYANSGYVDHSTGGQFIGYKKGATPSLQTNLLKIETADCLIWATSNYFADQIIAFKTEAERDEFVSTHSRYY